VLVAVLDAERTTAGEDYQDHGPLFCWANAG
jgi:hypothetical protein